VRILVLDDDTDILAMLGDTLRYEGYEVVERTDPATALADLEHVAPDLVILDWMFGGQAVGLAVLEQLQRHPVTAAVPVLVCSAAHRHVQHVADALTARGVGVLYKPFTLDELFAAVATLLRSDDHAGGARGAAR